MQESTQLLTICSDPEKRHDMAVVMEFMGEDVIWATPDDWQQKIADDNADVILAILLLLSPEQAQALVPLLYEQNDSIPTIAFCELNDDSIDELYKGYVIAQLPWPTNYREVTDTLYRAQVYRQQYNHKSGSRSQQREVQLFRSLVGTSRSVQQVRSLMSQVADKDVSVLIMGESGTGKEVVARNLHYNSHRRSKPFVPVNCGAIPGELLESELFGHEKGAFTGAISSRPGRFEMAQGGTLFLDEIGDMPLNMQVKILRVLQERTFERIGSNKTIEADVRIIAATHKNLEHMISEGDFREDLYYRLNVFPIDMPPLRERAEDIPLLMNELIARMEQEKRGSIRFNSAAILSLCRHDWPGNVRELANLVERLAIMHPYGVIGVKEMPKKFRHIAEGEEIEEDESYESQLDSGLPGLDAPALLPVNGIDLKDYLNGLEKTLIKQALDESSGVVARAAEKLRIRRTTLVEKVRKYKLQEDDKEAS